MTLSLPDSSLSLHTRTMAPSHPKRSICSESHGQNTLTKLNVEAHQRESQNGLHRAGGRDKLEPLPLRLPCYSSPLPEPSWPSWSNHCGTACIQLGGSESQSYRSALPQSHSNPLAELGLLESPNPSRCQGCLSQQWDSWFPQRQQGKRRWARAASHADRGRDRQEPESGRGNPVGSC